MTRKNSLTFSQHVRRIKQTQKDLRGNFLQLADQIRDACEQLDGDTQTTLSKELGMSQSNIAKWMAIGQNEVLHRFPQTLPTSFSTLYELTVLEGRYRSFYGQKTAEKKFVTLFEKKIVNPETSRKEVSDLVKEVRNLEREKSAKNIQDTLEQYLPDKELPKTAVKSVTDLLQTKLRYHTFVIIPTDEMMTRWRKLELSKYIYDEFPLADLRKTAHKLTLQCILQIQMKDIAVGLRCLDAFGFSHKDTLIPHQPQKTYVSMNNEVIFLRGVRGTEKRLVQDRKHDDWLAQNLPSRQETSLQLKSSKLKDVLDYAIQIGEPPFLLVGAETDNKQWVLCNE
tara:strand:+ start:653 stop:1669 length:1017 start_codon:yes stop_codon:yes gene_type:complete